MVALASGSSAPFTGLESFRPAVDGGWENRTASIFSLPNQQARSRACPGPLVNRRGISVLMLFFAQHQIQCPAAANMLARLAEVIEDFGAGATGFFERVGQNRQVRKAAFLVDGPRDGGDAGRPPGG